VVVADPVGDVAEDAGAQEADGHAGGGVAEGAADGEGGEDDQGHERQRDEHSVFLAEGAECGACVAPVDEGEEAGDNDALGVVGDRVDDEPFCELVEGVEEEDGRHRRNWTETRARFLH